MPSLAGSLLTLSSFLNGLSEFSDVKKHLLRASREVLLAVQGLLEVAEQYVASSADNPQSLSGVISYAQKTIRTIARQLPHGNEEEYRMLHRKVMNSILDVIEGEIRKSSRVKNPKSKMKSEVFEAIRNVLLKETYEQETKGRPKND